MYEFVNDAEIKPYRSYCSEILTDLIDLLLEKYEINTQFVLVGSGARNMVMRDGSGPFDLDYNLVIISMPELYWNDLGKLNSQCSTVISLPSFGEYTVKIRIRKLSYFSLQTFKRML